MFNFYINFLLKKYKWAESDISLRPLGYKFYTKHFDQFKKLGYKIYASHYQTQKLKELYSVDDMNKFVGDMQTNPMAGNYRFRICK